MEHERIKLLASAALGALLMALVPLDVHAQGSPRCEVVLHQLPVAERHSALQALDADEIALAGTVTDEETGEPIEGIVVRIEGTSRATTTDREGGYLFRHLGRDEALPARPMVSVCSLDWSHLREAREVFITTPWSGTVVVSNGIALPNPGHAVRLDFRVRRRPTEF